MLSTWTFRNFARGDQSVTNYCRRLKGMADALEDLGEKLGSGDGEWGKLTRWMGRGADDVAVVGAAGRVVDSAVYSGGVVAAAGRVVGAAGVVEKVVMPYLGIPEGKPRGMALDRKDA